MLSPIAEDYLKLILLEQEKLPHGSSVGMGAVAVAAGVTPGTATAMVQGLAEEGWLDYRKRHGCRLTDKGEDLATLVLRRHRLVETFLVTTLGMDWSEVHGEADRLEHAFSDAATDLLEEFLGLPTTDPHGDPIPNAVGWLDRRQWTRLADAPLHRPLRLVRLLDQSPEFLHFAKQRGLLPDRRLVLLDSGSISGATTLQVEGCEEAIALGQGAARDILVETLEGTKAGMDGKKA